MKLPVHCQKCTEGVTDPIEFQKHIIFLHVTDSTVYKIECSKGHSDLLLLKHFSYEILFEIAVQAIEDGYFREAISSFSSSLERFYEFFIKFSAVQDGELSLLEVDEAWKVISSSSERQLGSYVFCYLMYFGNSPKILKDKWRSLRNKVVHKGYIPTEQEALNFGKEVYQKILEVLLGLYDDHDGEFIKYCNEFQFNVLKNIKLENEGSTISQVDFPFILNWNRLHFEDLNALRTLEERIAKRPNGYSVQNN
jgi:hypothetical protein